MNDLISVIVPVYNAQKFIANCIRSIQKQTFPNWELILIDDGSKDQTLKLLEEIAKELDVEKEDLSEVIDFIKISKTYIKNV